MLSAVSRQFNVTFRDGPETTILCDSDEYYVGSILHILAHNGLRYAGPGSEVWLSWRSTPEVLEIAVHTNGRVIEDDIAKRLFEPGLSEAGTSGLGLYLARDFSQILGGNLVHLPSDKGAVFELTLPRRIQ